MISSEANHEVLDLIKAHRKKLVNPVLKILGIDQCISCGGCSDRYIHYSFMIDVVEKKEFEEFLEDPNAYTKIGVIVDIPIYLSRSAEIRLREWNIDKLQLIKTEEEKIALAVDKPS